MKIGHKSITSVYLYLARIKGIFNFTGIILWVYFLFFYPIVIFMTGSIEILLRDFCV